MPRKPRIVVPGLAHHVIQRGNDGREVFVTDDDRRAYLSILRIQARKHALRVLGYCLMSNHVHLIVIPENAESLAKTLAGAGITYTQRFNRLFTHSGHLWQGRYYSAAMDNDHFWQAMRYVERNPVRAALVDSAVDYPWSSARAHVLDRDDTGLLDMEFWSKSPYIKGWATMLMQETDPVFQRELYLSFRNGRPLGSADFLQTLATTIDLTLPRRGRPPKKRV